MSIGFGGATPALKGLGVVAGEAATRSTSNLVATSSLAFRSPLSV